MTDQQDRSAMEPVEPAPTAPVVGDAATRTRTLSRIAALGGAFVLGAGVVLAAVVVGNPGSRVAETGRITLVNGIDGGADGSAGTWGPRDGHRGMAFGNGPAEELAAAAEALGIAQADLETELAAGKTIAEVATARDVELQTVIDAITAVEKDEIAAALAAGEITQDQADRMTANLAQHVTDFVNGTGRGPGDCDGRGGRGGHGRHGHDGMGPGAPWGPDGSAGTDGPTS